MLSSGSLLSMHVTVPEATREEEWTSAALPWPLRWALRVSVANAPGSGGLAFLGSGAPGVVAVAQVRSMMWVEGTESWMSRRYVR